MSECLKLFQVVFPTARETDAYLKEIVRFCIFEKRRNVSFMVQMGFPGGREAIDKFAREIRQEQKAC